MLSDPIVDPADEETLDRFIYFPKHSYATGGLKPAAFVPHPYDELSVTRTKNASADELAKVANEIATARGRAFHGSARVIAKTYRSEKLKVLASPIPVGDPVHPDGNPNHADVRGWPVDKADQKAVAMNIAHTASFLPPSPL